MVKYESDAGLKVVCEEEDGVAVDAPSEEKEGRKDMLPIDLPTA